MEPKEITLDKPRHILFTLAGIGKAMPALGEALGSYPPNEVKLLVAFLWAGLLDEDPNLTLDDTIDLAMKYLTDPIERRFLLMEMGQMLASFSIIVSKPS